jgi:hypothetical protein
MALGRAQCNASIADPSIDSILVTAKSTRQRIYVQSITYTPTSYVAGTVLNFLDSLTGVSIGQISIVPVTVGYTMQYPLDFGDTGIALSLGANLKLAVASGGVIGRMLVKAYQLPLYVI